MHEPRETMHDRAEQHPDRWPNRVYVAQRNFPEPREQVEHFFVPRAGSVFPTREYAPVDAIYADLRERLRGELARPKGLLEGALGQVRAATAKCEINRGGLEEVLAEVIAALDTAMKGESDAE